MDERRALVLGSGGVTGLAWELGVLTGLAEAGVDVRADLVVGTSAGALLGARLAVGQTLDEVRTGLAVPESGLGRLSVEAVAWLAGAQLWPSRKHAIAALGRQAQREWTAQRQERWVAAVAGDLAGREWPEGLVVVAMRVASGHPAYFSARHPVDLGAAVAASCAMPGVFPAVRIEGELFFDGGLRSALNLDAASSAGRVLALAPLTRAVRAPRRPAVQAAHLERAGTPVVLLTPDGPGRAAIGLDVLASGRLSHALAAGHDLGLRRAGEVAARWVDG